MTTTEVYFHGFAATCALGEGPRELLDALRAGRAPGMRPRAGYAHGGVPACLGAWDGPLPELSAFPPGLRSRNNRLALRALEQIRPELEAAVAAFGADRVGVVLGSSTSGVAEAEAAFKARAGRQSLPEDFDYGVQELGSPALFAAQALGLKGPAFTLSTACSSSAKAFATARRLLRLGVCDAVLSGGVDTLCAFTVEGFQALGALSLEPSLPFSAKRRGINIGEAAAFFVLRREPSPLRLAGFGESNDAYNISAPRPDGRGAAAALRAALADAGLGPGDIDYLNLHGTGTPQNDAMESLAVAEVFPAGVPCSSTKPLTGHCLGAAGAIEAAIAAALLLDGSGFMPVHPWDGVPDPALPGLDLIAPGRRAPGALKRVLSSNFGFGGSNAALILERV